MNGFTDKNFLNEQQHSTRCFFLISEILLYLFTIMLLLMKNVYFKDAM